jgi:DNA-binding NtrC family response regulator
VVEKEISVLIVEDDDDSRTMMCALLETVFDGELVARSASSAEEAMKILEACRFHLVISDINLPGSSGLQLCELIQQMSPITPVIIVSAMNDIQYAIEAMRRRAFDYLVKPIDVDKLKEALVRAIKYQEMAMKRYNCVQSLQEDINDLMMLNHQLRQAAHPQGNELAKSQAG